MPKLRRFVSMRVVLLALVALLALLATSAFAGEEETASPASPENVTMDRLRVIAAALQSFVNDATSGEHRLERAPSDWVLASQPSKLVRIPAVSELLTYGELFDLFHPIEGASYLRDIPEYDGWGKRIEVYYAEEKLLAARVFSVRSSGANGRFDGDVYEIGGFLPGSETDDIVIADKRFVRWPLGTPEADLAVKASAGPDWNRIHKIEPGPGDLGDGYIPKAHP